MYAFASARMAVGLLMLALMAGCARPSQPTVPEAPRAATPGASQPAAVEPASLGYTLLINGKEVAPGSTVEADFSAPVELLLQSPIPVLRPASSGDRRRV